MGGRGRSGWVGALVLALALVGCGGADPGPASPDGVAEVPEFRGPEPVRLAPGESARIRDGSVLTFVGVAGDSRCPIDAVCVWEGNAQVEVRLVVGSEPPRVVRLGTSREPRSLEVAGGRLHLDLLEPSPRASEPIDPGQYRATFRFAPAEAGG